MQVGQDLFAFAVVNKLASGLSGPSRYRVTLEPDDGRLLAACHIFGNQKDIPNQTGRCAHVSSDDFLHCAIITFRPAFVLPMLAFRFHRRRFGFSSKATTSTCGDQRNWSIGVTLLTA